MSKGRKYDKIIEEDALYQIACKSAVKANKKLDDVQEEINEWEILEQLKEGSMDAETALRILKELKRT